MGLLAAVVTVTIWTGFIVIARASAQRTLTPLDIALLRITGASLVLLPWGWWMVRRRVQALGTSAPPSSLAGISPLPLRTTALLGLFGGLLYALLAYAGFFHAPATHASVLMPGSLPLWTALLAAWLLRDHITPLRAAGLALIVAGDLLVGGRSLLAAFSGGDVWKGDLLFMLAAACWATYSVLARRHAVDAVQATISITAFACLVYAPAYALLIALGAVTSHLAQAPWTEIAFQMAFQGGGSVVVSGIAFTRMIHALRAGALHHDHRAGARTVGHGRRAVPGRAHALEPCRRAAAGDRRYPCGRSARQPGPDNPGQHGPAPRRSLTPRPPHMHQTPPGP